MPFNLLKTLVITDTLDQKVANTFLSAWTINQYMYLKLIIIDILLIIWYKSYIIYLKLKKILIHIYLRKN